MKTIYFCNESISTNYAGDLDNMVTELFLSIIFAAYTIFIWELGGGLLSGATGLISVLCLTRVVFLLTEWVKGFINNKPQQPFAIIPNNKTARKQIAPKKKFKSRMFKMV